MKKDQHILPVKDGWAVRPEGDQNYISIHKTWHEAIDAARKIAKKEKAEIIIHRQSEHPLKNENITKRPYSSGKKDKDQE